jgi:hypothetical protein
MRRPFENGFLLHLLTAACDVVDGARSRQRIALG